MVHEKSYKYKKLYCMLIYTNSSHEVCELHSILRGSCERVYINIRASKCVSSIIKFHCPQEKNTYLLGQPWPSNRNVKCIINPKFRIIIFFSVFSFTIYMVVVMWWWLLSGWLSAVTGGNRWWLMPYMTLVKFWSFWYCYR